MKQYILIEIKNYIYTPSVLDVNGNAVFGGYIVVVDNGAENNPTIRFTARSDMGLYTHNIGGDDYGVSFTNVSGNILQVNKDEVKFYRNAEWT